MALAGIITAAFGIVFGLLGIATTDLVNEFMDAFMSGFEDAMQSYPEDSSSFNNNNNAIIGLFNLIKRVIGL